MYKKHGFLYLMLPEEYGGLGRRHYLALPGHRGACQGVGLVLSHSASAPCRGDAYHGGSERRQKRYIYGKLTQPDELNLVAFCLTEPEAGSDASHMRTAATKEGDHYYLNGKKSMITNGANSQFLTVFATTNPAARTAAFPVFVLRRIIRALSSARAKISLA